MPIWWKDSLSKLPATFNARAETVAEKPMFRSAFKARRCVIPASGFYEWTGAKGAKTPHYFSAPNGRPLAFAGLWESASHPDTRQIIDSATIIVGAPSNPRKIFFRRGHYAGSCAPTRRRVGGAFGPGEPP
ncbi:SOS response-associated peptidase [Methylocystis suflitae]|uniref:SOS response-associated peptidase n=1 Tax=Methylocystis suflitae TaxID=2951405 RepID=UPI00210B391A|nr:SOS response-associated peptidase family protein [Methylocystis suflitae]MCQ4190942.1 SOS response-associated peptidase [Methylocystis suflitae]